MRPQKPLAETHEVRGKWTPKKTKLMKDDSEKKQNVIKAREDITKVPLKKKMPSKLKKPRPPKKTRKMF